jgi:alanine racemase
MNHETQRAWVDVDLGALRRNADAVRRHTGRPLLPMIKADAYGLGAVQVARALQPISPWGLGIATLDEAAQLRDAGIDSRVILFSPLLAEDMPRAIALRVTPTLGDEARIRAWGAATDDPWHLALDTGMHRAGVEWWRVRELRDAIHQYPPEGAFTHLHSPEDLPESAEMQRARFREAVAQLPRVPQLLHVDGSPSFERQTGCEWSVVRPGVFLYGVGGGAGALIQPEPVVQLNARVLEVHAVRSGETVSYGATWTADGDRAIATVGLGYADGYRRIFSNRGIAIVKGKRVQVVGRVTMDMTMLDVTGLAVKPGDVATFVSRDPADALDVNVVAGLVDLLPYELLVGLRLRLPRIYHGG